MARGTPIPAAHEVVFYWKNEEVEQFLVPDLHCGGFRAQCTALSDTQYL
jgi:hypothetical protein